MKTTIIAAAVAATTVGAQSIQSAYGQCGGSGYTGASICTAGYTCSTQAGGYYAQCTPGTAKPTTTAKSSTLVTSTTPKPASTTATTTARLSSTSSKATSTAAAPSAAPASGKVQYAGINIAGCDFGIDTSGNAGTPVCPSTVGPAQMKHFHNDDGLNIFRIPTGWQYLVNNKLGGTLDATFFATYDAIMQSCLALSGTKCILDVHNYARWNGGIIGQGGPTDDQFVSLWTQLATKYKSNANVVFGIMNEPHDLNIATWATTVQKVVTAIRNTGATSQIILLPGTDYTGAGTFATNSAPALSKVTNPDGSTTNLIYDVHRYLDSDGSGTSATCVTDRVSDSFSPLATYLRANKRQAFVSEIGGANNAGCETYLCSTLDFLNKNSDVFLGWTGWAAGSFDQSYVLSETPNGSVDQPIVSMCIAGKFK